MFKVIKAAFSQRRKTLVNSVSSSTDIAKETILKSLNEMGLSESVRGETLSLEQFAELSDRIIENSWCDLIMIMNIDVRYSIRIFIIY